MEFHARNSLSRQLIDISPIRRGLWVMFTLTQHIEKRLESFDGLAAAAPRQRLALLLAGGDGTRLQKLTAQLTGVPIPKQYCPLLRGRSLLELTLSRTHYFATPENTRVVVNQNHLALARTQLGGLPQSNIFVQPETRDTGPGIIFALAQMARTHPDATVAVFPTDHFVDDDRTFIAHVLRAACLVHRFPAKIAILGVTPDHAEPGYGYILPGQPLHSALTPSRICHVRAFKEKPSPIMAREFISQDGLWNTFVMVFQLKRMLELLKTLAPRNSQKLFDLHTSSEDASVIYRDIDPWNFSSQILARIPNELIVFEVPDIRWSDWGTRESIERTYRDMNLVPAWRENSGVLPCR
jgi:mannose-1-phosphate guanylyltransferase